MAALLLGIPYYTIRNNGLSSVKFLTNYYFPGRDRRLASWESFQCASYAKKILIQFVQGAENLLEFLSGHFGTSSGIASISSKRFKKFARSRQGR